MATRGSHSSQNDSEIDWGLQNIIVTLGTNFHQNTTSGFEDKWQTRNDQFEAKIATRGSYGGGSNVNID